MYQVLQSLQEQDLVLLGVEAPGTRKSLLLASQSINEDPSELLSVLSMENTPPPPATQNLTAVPSLAPTPTSLPTLSTPQPPSHPAQQVVSMKTKVIVREFNFFPNVSESLILNNSRYVERRDD